eukprot:1196031-Prorocentrum_minimum.AAC.6
MVTLAGETAAQHRLVICTTPGNAWSRLVTHGNAWSRLRLVTPHRLLASLPASRTLLAPAERTAEAPGGSGGSGGGRCAGASGEWRGGAARAGAVAGGPAEVHRTYGGGDRLRGGRRHWGRGPTVDHNVPHARGRLRSAPGLTV